MVLSLILFTDSDTILTAYFLRMAASSQEERDEWIRAIEESIEENPFCRIIEEKKASRRHMEQNAS